MVKGYFEKDEAKKKELEEKMKNEVAPAWVKNMTTILTSNGGQWLVGKGVSQNNFFKYVEQMKIKKICFNYKIFYNLTRFILQQLTWADIAVSMIVEMMAAKDEAILTKCPPLGDHMKRVHSQPKIKAWIEKRPKTAM